MAADILSVHFNHLTRSRASARHGEDVGKVIVGGFEPNAQRVSVKHFDSGQRRVVVKLAGRDRCRACFVATDQLAFDQKLPRGLDLWVE